MNKHFYKDILHDQQPQDYSLSHLYMLQLDEWQAKNMFLPGTSWHSGPPLSNNSCHSKDKENHKRKRIVPQSSNPIPW